MKFIKIAFKIDGAPSRGGCRWGAKYHWKPWLFSDWSKIHEKETENVASNVESEICIEELPDKSIGKCFADTSNIENEVPNETLNVKDTQIPWGDPATVLKGFNGNMGGK